MIVNDLYVFTIFPPSFRAFRKTWAIYISAQKRQHYINRCCLRERTSKHSLFFRNAPLMKNSTWVKLVLRKEKSISKAPQNRFLRICARNFGSNEVMEIPKYCLYLVFYNAQLAQKGRGDRKRRIAEG